MQINLIFALIITLSGNFVALAEKKDETLGTTHNFTNKHDEAANNNALAKNAKLTGIPQVDYIYDPNLPRELRGYNLSSYPFFSSVPPEEDIHFKCDGLHDGFYASIEHKCQIYHHCVYGIRHDFLCANFTAFDQKTFICHFVSDVDCEGSKKYWNRNDALYMPTTTTSTTTTTTEPPPTQAYRRPVRPQRPLRRPLKRRPINDYYYDEEYQDEFYDEPVNRRPISNRSRPRKPIVEYDYEEETLPRRPAGNRYRVRVKNEELEDDYQESQTSVKQYKTSNKADKQNAYAGERAIYRKDKHQAVEDNGPQATTDISRRFSVRRRINKTPVNNKQQSEEAIEESRPRNTPPPTPEEYVTPKTANPTIYGLPRTPPRIGRPVPINEKKKYEYPVVKASATTAPQVQHAKEEEYTDDVVEYYDNNSDYDYANERVTAPKVVAKRPLKEPVADTLDDYDAPVVPQRKRFRNETPYKNERVRKNKKTVQPVYADYEDEIPVAPVRRTPIRPRVQGVNKKDEDAPIVPLKRKLINRAKQNVEVEEELLPEDEQEEIVEERATKKSDVDVPVPVPRERHIAPMCRGAQTSRRCH